MNLRPARGTPAWVLALAAVPVVVRPAPVRVACALGAAAVLAFFRDPDREPDGPGLLSPADGKVREVSEHDGRWLVSVYLNLFNVHVTRSPCAGTVRDQVYRRGAHKPAFSAESHGNESVSWTFDGPHGPLELVQYAGLLARRIVPYLPVGAPCARGERIGLIRFGSRVDVLLPTGFVPTVGVGDAVVGASTVIGVEDN